MHDSWRVPEMLREVRDLRFSTGSACPRCGSARVVKWGSFSGRQRYKCRGCRRTFSDLTGTPLAYSKRVEAWADYLRCVREGRTVRDAARRAGISKDTAFRWRHRLLRHVRERERPQLRGIVELQETRFGYSEKGQRERSQPARLASSSRAYWSPHVRVLLCVDRAGSRWSAIKGSRYVWEWSDEAVGARSRLGPPGQRWDDALRPVLLGEPTLVGKRRWLSFTASAATRMGLRYMKGTSLAPARLAHRHYADQQLGRGLYHLEHVAGLERRLRIWMERFHGVATKYLANYLAWHRLVDPFEPESIEREILGRALSTPGKP